MVTPSLILTHELQMASAAPEQLERAGSGSRQAENLVLDIPLAAEGDRPMPVKHVYVSVVPLIAQKFVTAAI